MKKIKAFVLKHKNFFFLIILIAAVCTVYFKTLNYDLVYDSKIYLEDSPLFETDRPLSDAFKSSYSGKIGTEQKGHYYRPVTTFSFLLEKKLWGIKNICLRIINILIFVFSIIVLFLLLKKQDEPPAFPFIAVTIFALFPLNLDNIAWVVGRSDLFLLLFGLCALYFLQWAAAISAAEYPGKEAESSASAVSAKGRLIGCPGRGLLFISSFFYALALLSKEAALFLFPVLLVYEWVKSRKITPLFHLANLFITVGFFAIKAAVVKSALMKFTFFPGFLKNITVPLATIGYYFKSLILCYDYTVYQPIHSSVNAANILFGLLCVGVMALLLLYAANKIFPNSVYNKKDSLPYPFKQNMFIPLALILFFLFGHLPLVFFDVLVFRASSRFMIFPTVGFAWILARLLSRAKPFLRNIAVSALILLFIPTLLINASAYKNETAYWEKMTRSYPRDSHCNYQLAAALFAERNFSAVFALNKALLGKADFTTFVNTALLYEEIEFLRGNYDLALKWLGRVKNVTDTGIRAEIALRKANIYQARGDVAKIEETLDASLKTYDKKRYYRILHEVYCGFLLWEKAAQVEIKMAAAYPGEPRLSSAEIRQGFEQSNREQKLEFFIKYRNYKAAIEMLSASPGQGNLKRDLYLVRLYYVNGRPAEAERIIKEWAAKGAGNSQVLNALGHFYLNEMMRIGQALAFFRQSLEVNAGQPQLERLVNYIEQKMRADGIRSL